MHSDTKKTSANDTLKLGRIYQCIIFDCDGILVDSEGISAVVYQEMARELGFDLDFDTAMERFAGTAMTENLRFIAENIKGTLPPTFEAEFRRRSYERFARDLQPIPGIHDLLQKVTVPYCVASSGPQEKIRTNLTVTGLIDKFEDRIFSSYDIGSWKPDPGIFLHAAKQMGFPPGHCLVVEDSPSGVQAAVAGGCAVYAMADSKKKAVFERLGATVFHDMPALQILLGMD